MHDNGGEQSRQARSWRARLSKRYAWMEHFSIPCRQPRIREILASRPFPDHGLGESNGASTASDRQYRRLRVIKKTRPPHEVGRSRRKRGLFHSETIGLLGSRRSEPQPIPGFTPTAEAPTGFFRKLLGITGGLLHSNHDHGTISTSAPFLAGRFMVGKNAGKSLSCRPVILPQPISLAQGSSSSCTGSQRSASWKSAITGCRASSQVSARP
jgi:hypothetical protein